MLSWILQFCDNMKSKKRIISYALVIIAIILTGTLLSGCIQEAPSTDQRDLIITLSTDKTSYAVGENVSILITYTNPGEEDISLKLMTGQKTDFDILNEKGDQVYLWSHGKTFTQAIWNLKIPGRKIVELLNTTWDQTDNNGVSVPGGTYTIRAGMNESTRLNYTVIIQIQ